MQSMRYLRSKGIDVIMDWPARSPDLNPIELLWARLKREVSKRGPTDVEDLEAFVRECWDAIPQREIDDLVKSFSSRLERCTENNGVTI